MEQTFRSFAEQAMHYFQRDHDEIVRKPLSVPAAWQGVEMVRRDDWVVRLDAADLAELERASAGAADRGKSLGTLTRADFVLPVLARRIEQWRRELDVGRGFVLLRGLPVERWGDERSSLVFWGLGLHLGIPGGQNPQEELLGHVVDTGEEATNPAVRRYRTAGDIAYHCDLADVVGLLCLRAGRSGGASRIVSSVAVYNELVSRRPDLVERLYEPFLLDARDESRAGMPPYFPVPPCRAAGGRLRTFYHSDYFRSVVRHPDVPPFTTLERELLDTYEEIARSPELYLDMQFEPGDVQLLSNHVILHARTAYEDWPEPERKRHLLRLWLSFS